MKKLKTLTLLILCVSLFTPQITAQEPGQSGQSCATEYGIDLSKTYSGGDVMEIIADAEALIDEAYAEGYKAGLLEAAPDAAYYRAVNESLQKELAAEKDVFRLGLSGCLAAAALSFIGGAVSGALIAR
jgi:hypothetical protein